MHISLLANDLRCAHCNSQNAATEATPGVRGPQDSSEHRC